MAYTGDELHYAYVAQDFRQKGLVPFMLDGVAIRRFTFATEPGMRRIRPSKLGWIYTPRWTL